MEDQSVEFVSQIGEREFEPRADSADDADGLTIAVF